MTGTHELCMLIDRVVKRFPTAIVKIDTPYYKGTVKALCMENPVQELIVGNVSGAKGVEACYEAEVTEQSEVICGRHEVEGETQPKLESGPMPNLMVALPNIGGALCSTKQSLADAHY